MRLVFVRVAIWSDYAGLAWQNSPQIFDGRIIFALDYGPQGNQPLIDAYPQRKVYYYDRTQTVPLVAGR